MPRPDFRRLQRELHAMGMASGTVRRTIAELGDHYDDLVDNAMSDGMDKAAAEMAAAKQLGPLQNIVTEARDRPELRGWAFRFPRLALVVYPITCLALLPAMPVFAGIANATQLARWTACVVVSGFVTAAIMLVLQLSIVLG